MVARSPRSRRLTAGRIDVERRHAIVASGPPEPSAELIRRAQAGCPAALHDLIESQQSYVYSIALSVMRDPCEAADASQETFLRVLRVLPSYRGETKFTTWLFRVVTNVCLDGLRRGRRLRALPAPDEDSPPGLGTPDPDLWAQPEAHVERTETVAEVRRALRLLPPAQRRALTLRYVGDLECEAVASAMGIPLNTAKSHMRRGKANLAVLVRQVAPAEGDGTVRLSA
jgi:RNA polymerase sigma-70 factor (ECF subfamily)